MPRNATRRPSILPSQSRSRCPHGTVRDASLGRLRPSERDPSSTTVPGCSRTCVPGSPVLRRQTSTRGGTSSASADNWDYPLRGTSDWRSGLTPGDVAVSGRPLPLRASGDTKSLLMATSPCCRCGSSRSAPASASRTAATIPTRATQHVTLKSERKRIYCSPPVVVLRAVPDSPTALPMRPSVKNTS